MNVLKMLRAWWWSLDNPDYIEQVAPLGLSGQQAWQCHQSGYPVDEVVALSLLIEYPYGKQARERWGRLGPGRRSATETSRRLAATCSGLPLSVWLVWKPVLLGPDFVQWLPPAPEPSDSGSPVSVWLNRTRQGRELLVSWLSDPPKQRLLVEWAQIAGCDAPYVTRAGLSMQEAREAASRGELTRDRLEMLIALKATHPIT